MRVEVIRSKINLNLPRIKEAGEKAMNEARLVVISMRQKELAAFHTKAKELEAEYKIVAALEYETNNTTIYSIYFDFQDQTKGVYFKLSTEPLITKS